MAACCVSAPSVRLTMHSAAKHGLEGFANQYSTSLLWAATLVVAISLLFVLHVSPITSMERMTAKYAPGSSNQIQCPMHTRNPRSTSLAAIHRRT